MTALTPEQAQAFVDSLPEISGARTLISRVEAARRTRLAERGVRVRSFEVDDETIADLAQCRELAGITNRQALRQAVAMLRIAVGGGLTKDGAEAFSRLQRMTQADAGEVADFCYRFTLQELRRCGRVALD